MNIHSSLVMAVYIISGDGVGDGYGLIIKSSFNCILRHCDDVSELARVFLSLFMFMHLESVKPADVETGSLNVFSASLTSVDEKMKPR